MKTFVIHFLLERKRNEKRWIESNSVSSSGMIYQAINWFTETDLAVGCNVIEFWWTKVSPNSYFSFIAQTKTKCIFVRFSAWLHYFSEIQRRPKETESYPAQKKKVTFLPPH